MFREPIPVMPGERDGFVFAGLLLQRTLLNKLCRRSSLNAFNYAQYGIAYRTENASWTI